MIHRWNPMIHRTIRDLASPLSSAEIARISKDFSSLDLDVIRLIREGYENKKIAKTLRIHPGAVNRHVSKIARRLSIWGGHHPQVAILTKWYLLGEPAKTDDSANKFLNELAPRLQKVFAGAVANRTTKEIADEVGVKPNTVRKYLDAIYRRIEAHPDQNVIHRASTGKCRFNRLKLAVWYADHFFPRQEL